MKKNNRLLVLGVMMVVLACNPSTPQEATDQKPVNLQHEAFINEYYRYFNQHDWAKMAAMYSEEADFKDPSLGAGIVKQTRQQTIDKYTELSTIFPDIKDEVKAIYPSGDQHVIVEFISSGTGPDGEKFELPICTIFTIENGQITKDFTYYDNFGEESANE